MPAGITYIGNTRSSPRWAGDYGGRDHIEAWPAKIDPTLFVDQAGIVVTVSGTAAQNATSISISALVLSALANTVLVAQGNVLIPSGTVLDFGGGKFARLTADAINGATTLTVSALPTALAAADTATYSWFGTTYIPSGVLISRSNPNRTSTGLFGPANLSHEEIYLLYDDIADAKQFTDCTMYRHRWLVKENYLPNYAAMVADSGITNPTVAPTLGHAGSDGSASAGAIQVGYTFSNALGETLISPLASVTKLTTEHISVADITFLTNATAINFYASVAPASGILGYVKSLTAHGATTLLTDGAGVRIPSANQTKGSLGSNLDWIRANYDCIQGVN